MVSDKRVKILKAAVKIFARDGFFTSRMEDIAKVAGVATGTTYLYFKNKDDLLISIFEEEMVPIIEEMKIEISQRKTALEKINCFIKHHFKMVKEKEDMAQLLQVEIRQSNKFIHAYKGTKFKEYLDIIGHALEEGQANGEFRQDIKPTIFKQFLFGAIDQLATNWTLSKTKKIDLDQLGAQIEKLVAVGINA